MPLLETLLSLLPFLSSPSWPWSGPVMCFLPSDTVRQSHDGLKLWNHESKVKLYPFMNRLSWAHVATKSWLTRPPLVAGRQTPYVCLHVLSFWTNSSTYFLSTFKLSRIFILFAIILKNKTRLYGGQRFGSAIHTEFGPRKRKSKTTWNKHYLSPTTSTHILYQERWHCWEFK